MYKNRYGIEFLTLCVTISILTIILVRFFLYITNYPQISTDELHIAHLLPGGLLLFTSVFISLVFRGYRSDALVSIFSGIGFGLFIDEIGKFVTSDNDYFYKPAVVLIYLIFVVIIIMLFYFSRRSKEGILSLVSFIVENSDRKLAKDEEKKLDQDLEENTNENKKLYLIAKELEAIFKKSPKDSRLSFVINILYSIYNFLSTYFTRDILNVLVPIFLLFKIFFIIFENLIPDYFSIVLKIDEIAAMNAMFILLFISELFLMVFLGVILMGFAIIKSQLILKTLRIILFVDLICIIPVNLYYNQFSAVGGVMITILLIYIVNLYLSYEE